MKKTERFSQEYPVRQMAKQLREFIDRVPSEAVIYIHGFDRSGTGTASGKVEALLETDLDTTKEEPDPEITCIKKGWAQ